jgi:hypothetical protein
MRFVSSTGVGTRFGSGVQLACADEAMTHQIDNEWAISALIKVNVCSSAVG